MAGHGVLQLIQQDGRDEAPDLVPGGVVRGGPARIVVVVVRQERVQDAVVGAHVDHARAVTNQLPVFVEGLVRTVGPRCSDDDGRRVVDGPHALVRALGPRITVGPRHDGVTTRVVTSHEAQVFGRDGGRIEQGHARAHVDGGRAQGGRGERGGQGVGVRPHQVAVDAGR